MSTCKRAQEGINGYTIGYTNNLGKENTVISTERRGQGDEEVPANGNVNKTMPPQRKANT